MSFEAQIECRLSSDQHGPLPLTLERERHGDTAARRHSEHSEHSGHSGHSDNPAVTKQSGSFDLICRPCRDDVKASSMRQRDEVVGWVALRILWSERKPDDPESMDETLRVHGGSRGPSLGSWAVGGPAQTDKSSGAGSREGSP
jgi:hypothetical protein